METSENTETIAYQGERIEAEKIGEIGGYMGTLRGRQRNGTDHLFRDAEGRYYLRRERFTAIESGGHDYTHEARAAGAVSERTHAINVNAAILWAVNLLGFDAFYLRRDAAELLMEGRGYFDPHPVHLSPERRAMVTDPDRFAGLPTAQRGATARLPEEVTVPVTMPLALYRRILAMAAYDGRANVSEAIANSMEGDVEAWLESGSLAARKGNSNPKHFLAEFERELDAAKHPTVYPPPLAVTLDAEAARLARRVVVDDAEVALADVVNGAVRYNYGEETEENGGMVTDYHCLEAARAARLREEVA